MAHSPGRWANPKPAARPGGPATKGLAAIALTVAHSRGWLDYEERVWARSSGSLLLRLSDERFGWLGGAVSEAIVDHPRIHGIRWTRPSASTPCATV
jgi:hypothetical protein